MDGTMRGLGWTYQPKWKDKKTGGERFSPIWWIAYSVRGKLIRESSHSTKESDARKLLKKRHGEVGLGKPVGPDIDKTTFEDMATMLVNDYKANRRRSLGRMEDAINHLRRFFGDSRGVEMTGDRVTAYVAQRQEERAANATVNYELSALGRMFALAIRAGKAASKPYIVKLHLDNARKGFFEHDAFETVLLHLPEDLEPVAICAYVTGWRVHDEILTRQRHHLDLKAGWLRLEPGETKNGKGRMFPLTPMLRKALEKQVAKTEVLQRSTGQIIPWLFHRNGRQIKNFRRSWLTACVNAGLGKRITDSHGKLIKVVAHRIPHDFRRTAVRNLERAGVPRSAAMEMVGHKTEAIYRRYAIADEALLKEAASKLERLHATDQAFWQSNGKVEGENEV
jgi:site-specific recombinase XerD